MRDPSSAAWNRHIEVLPASGNQSAWSALVPQSAVRVWTCPPACSQYAACAGSAPPDGSGDVAVVDDPAAVLTGPERVGDALVAAAEAAVTTAPAEAVALASPAVGVVEPPQAASTNARQPITTGRVFRFDNAPRPSLSPGRERARHVARTRVGPDVQHRTLSDQSPRRVAVGSAAWKSIRHFRLPTGEFCLRYWRVDSSVERA